MTTPSTPSCAANSTPARGPPGPSRLRRREPRKRSTQSAPQHRPRPRQSSRSSSSPSTSNGATFATAAPPRQIRIIGDIAIFVSIDSADVWAHPDLFELDEDL